MSSPKVLARLADPMTGRGYWRLRVGRFELRLWAASNQEDSS